MRMEENRKRVPLGRVIKYGDGEKVIYMITEPIDSLRYDGTVMGDICVLVCEFNILEKIRDLPSNLTILNLSNNRIDYIEEIPKSLKSLNLESNMLQILPDIGNICKLRISNNRLRSLPDIYGSNITELHIDNNLLEELPSLPKNLRILYMDGNMIEKLPDLPKSMAILSCKNNRIRHLSIEYLKFLSCDDEVLFESIPGVYSASPPKRIKYANYNSRSNHRNRYEVPSLQAITKARILKSRIDYSLSYLNHICLDYMRDRNRRCDVCLQEISADMFDKVLYTKCRGYTAHTLGCVMCPKSH